MSDLHIPDAAYEAANRFYADGQPGGPFGVVEAVAPIIVAAELRRLADAAIERTEGLPVDVAAFGELRMHAAWLRIRADELDGGVS